MNFFDHALIVFLNQWSQRWPEFDRLVVIASNSDLLKGGTVVAAVWGAWFYDSSDQQKHRRYLLSAIFGSLVALFVARVLAAVLPLRIRPLLDYALHFRPPKGLPDQSNWTIWSSFPSDHAALFFALALGVFYVSKKWGAVLFAYITVAICLPRIYIGIHYPTDILSGGALGLAVVALLAIPKFAAVWTRPILLVLERRPVLFYILFFLLTFQIATLFWDFRVVLSHYGFFS